MKSKKISTELKFFYLLLKNGGKKRHEIWKSVNEQGNRETDFYGLFVFIPKDYLEKKLVRFQE